MKIFLNYFFKNGCTRLVSYQRYEAGKTTLSANFLLVLKLILFSCLYSLHSSVWGITLFTNKMEGDRAFGSGSDNEALAPFSSAIGNGNVARGLFSISIGSTNLAGWGISQTLPSLDPFLLLNDPNKTFTVPRVLKNREYIVGLIQSNIVAMGISNVSLGEKSIAIGIGNFSSSPNSIAIGKSNFVSGARSQAFGEWNTVKVMESNSFGYGNVIDENAQRSSAIGLFNYLSSNKSYSFGAHNKVKSSFSNSIGLENSIAENSKFSSIFGTKNSITSYSSLALGLGNSVYGHHSIAIGSADANSRDDGYDLQNGSLVTGDYGISIGHKNNLDAEHTVTIGNFINANSITNSVILGSYSVGAPASTMPSSVKIKFGGLVDGLEIMNNWRGLSNSSNGSVSIGRESKERQIKYVATGEVSATSTDAINGSQLFATIQAIGNVTLKFKGDSDEISLNKRLGDIVSFEGGANGLLSENNIGIIVDNQKINIKLARDLFNINSISFENGTRLDNSGLSITNGPSISTNGIDVKSQPIKNVLVSENSEDKDAVNKGYVDGLIRNQSNSKLTLISNLGTYIKKFTDPIFVLGTTEDIRQQEYDSSNVVTWIDDDKLRIGTKKNFVLKTLTATDEQNKSIEISSDSIIFKKLINNNENLRYIIQIHNNGLNNIMGENIARITLNGSSLAMTQDGFKLFANTGDGIPLELGKSISIQGNNSNLNEGYFDDGGNISTKIQTTDDGAKLSIAFKKSPEFESLTLNGSQTESPQLILKNHSGSKKITLNVDNGNGEISVEGKTPKNLSRLSNDGVYLQNQSNSSKLTFKDEGTGSVDSLDSNKRRLTHTFNYKGETKTEEIATLEDGIIFNGNVRSGNGAAKLNKTVNISGADSNKNWDEFDNGENIMTKVESNNGETIIRIAMRNNLKIKNGEIGGNGSNGELKLKDKDGNEGITLNPDKIIFNNISKLDKDGNLKKNGSAGITMTQNGKPNLVDKGPATRILITDDKGNAIDEVATMKDGLKFGANIGGEKSNLLNSKVVVSGNKNNTDWSKFDEGSNLMTNIDQSSVGQTNITIALKRDLELDSATFGHGPNIVESTNTQKSGKDGYIKVVNKEGKTAIVIDSGNTSNGEGPSITVSGTKSVGGGLLYYLMV